MADKRFPTDLTFKATPSDNDNLLVSDSDSGHTSKITTIQALSDKIENDIGIPDLTGYATDNNVLNLDQVDAYIPTSSYHPVTKTYVDTADNLLATKVNVLELDQITPYTPLSDYHPVTKKYVDDGMTLHIEDLHALSGSHSEDVIALSGAIDDHLIDYSNPHVVTQSQVGMGDYPTLTADLPISTATQTAFDLKSDITYTDNQDSALQTQIDGIEINKDTILKTIGVTGDYATWDDAYAWLSGGTFYQHHNIVFKFLIGVHNITNSDYVFKGMGKIIFEGSSLDPNDTQIITNSDTAGSGAIFTPNYDTNQVPDRVGTTETHFYIRNMSFQDTSTIKTPYLVQGYISSVYIFNCSIQDYYMISEIYYNPEANQMFQMYKTTVTQTSASSGRFQPYNIEADGFSNLNIGGCNFDFLANNRALGVISSSDTLYIIMNDNIFTNIASIIRSGYPYIALLDFNSYNNVDFIAPTQDYNSQTIEGLNRIVNGCFVLDGRKAGGQEFLQNGQNNSLSGATFMSERYTADKILNGQQLVTKDFVINNGVPVSNTAELEDALARQEPNIFLKAGPTYILTQSIVPYDGLTLKGEKLPTDDNNIGSDGVLIFATTYAPILYDTTSAGLTAISGLTITDGIKSDVTLTVTAGLTTTIAAGTVITFDTYSYIVTSDVVPVGGSGTIRLDRNIVRDFIEKNSFDLYTTPLTNFKIENVNIDDDDDYSCLIYGGKNIKVINCNGSSNGYRTILHYSNVGVEIKEGSIFSNIINNSSGITISDISGDKIPDSDIRLYNCSYFTIDNCRGTRIYISECHYFDIHNIHSDINQDYVTSHYFTIDSCSSRNAATGFDCNNSSNFSVTNCAADYATTKVNTTGASNYQIYANRWQNEVVHSDITDSLSGAIDTNSTQLVDDSDNPIIQTDTGSTRISGDVDVTGHTNVQAVHFLPGTVSDDQAGEMYWDENNSTVSLVTGLGNTVQIGQETWGVGRNVTGGTVYDGNVVFMDGASLGVPQFHLGHATGPSPSASTHLGVVTIPTVADNAIAPITVFGIVNDIDTSDYIEGDFLYLRTNPTAVAHISGSMTTTKPVYPDHVVLIATVLLTDAVSGQIFVNPQHDPHGWVDHVIDSRAYGEISIEGNSDTMTASASPGWAIVENFSQISPYTNTTPSSADNSIIIGLDGDYIIQCPISALNGAQADDFLFKVFIDGISSSGLTFSRSFGGTDTGSGMISGIVALTAGQEVDLRIQAAGADRTITVEWANLAVNRLSIT